MLSVQKINFRANTPSLLQQNFATSSISAPKNQPSVTPTPPDVFVPNNLTPDQQALKTAKTVSYVGAGAALLSMGAVVVLAAKNGKISKALKELKEAKPSNITEDSDLVKKIGDVVSEKVETLKTDITKTVNEQIGDLKNVVEENKKIAKQDTVDLGKWQDGQIAGVSEQARAAAVQANPASVVIEHHPVMQAVPGIDFVSPVMVNNKVLNLADVYNQVSSQNGMLEHDLRSESAKRILGVMPHPINHSDNIMIRVPTAEVVPFTSTGGMAIVPKEVAENLAALINGKQKVQIVIDTPLYRGEVANGIHYSLEKDHKTGLYNYVKSFENNGAPDRQVLGKLQLIDEIEPTIYTDKNKTKEKVRIFMTEIHSELDYESVSKNFDEEFLDTVDKAIQEKGFFENDLLKIEQSENGRKVSTKIKYVFYDNDKFKLDIPIDTVKKDIYANNAISAGETERFVYFSKFFYEHMLDTSNSKVPLRTDLIVGNDWQTGPISAMVRQLTTARKFYGMESQKAESIKNTPIVTILHNAGLTGNVWHSQDKLLNIMFGEHSAKIVANSHVPNTSINGQFGLPGNILNGLFDNENLHPQIMAANYSDYIVPVSGPKYYADEIATDGGFGGAAQPLFKFRARLHEFSDIENLKFIAKQNGIDSNLIKADNPTMIGITNGSDKLANTLTKGKIKTLQSKEKGLNLPENSFKVLNQGDDVLAWHNHNKKSYINKVISEIDLARNSNGLHNPMKIERPDLTDLTGVDENTPIFATAGRIVEQKGLDIFAESIREFYQKYTGKNYPVFYAQGAGDRKYIEPLLRVKEELAKTNPEAAKRIVFANLFSEPGRYDGAKLMSDFSIMSSWFEPCGLVHKQISNFSGAVPIVTETGGLTHGYINKVNAIFSKFVPRHHSGNALQENASNFSDALIDAIKLYENKSNFSKAVKLSVNADFSWLQQGGPIYDYAKIFVKLGVIKPEVLGKEASSI